MDIYDYMIWRGIMFAVNEYVVYGSEGVCMVESVGHPPISGLDNTKEYYTLVPFYRTGKIYAPVESRVKIRKALSKDEVQGIINGISDVNTELEVPKDNKQAQLYYKEMVMTYDCSNLIRIIKYVFNKQKEFSTVKKNVPAVDLRYMKIAEDMLYNEFGFALGIDPRDVRGYIIKCCE